MRYSRTPEPTGLTFEKFPCAIRVTAMATFAAAGALRLSNTPHKDCHLWHRCILIHRSPPMVTHVVPSRPPPRLANPFLISSALGSGSRPMKARYSSAGSALSPRERIRRRNSRRAALRFSVVASGLEPPIGSRQHLPVARGLEPVFRGGFYRGNFVQRCQETFVTAAFGHTFHAGPAGKLFGQGRCHNPLHGNLLLRSQVGNLAVHFVGDCDVESHGASPIIARNSRGEITRTPKRSAPAKSLVLKVTTKSARLSTASSRTKSSFGSGRRGRQRKKMGRRFALAQRKHTTLSMSLPPRLAPMQTRLSVCSYSRTRGTERLIRHRRSTSRCPWSLSMNR